VSFTASAEINNVINERNIDENTEYSKPNTPIKGKKHSITEKRKTRIKETKYFLDRNMNDLFE